MRRFGFAELLKKPFRLLFGGWILRSLRPGTFDFENRRLHYFYHRYNTTWVNERAVEVPIAMTYIEKARVDSTLEIGNVLSHYYPIAHRIIDKYEQGDGIISVDVLDYNPSTKFDLIISISTFEHIGFDDEPTEPSGQKIAAAIQHCRSLLKPGGKLVLTLPIGYNPDVDLLLGKAELPFTRETYLRQQQRGKWAVVQRAEAMQCRFKALFPYANAIAVIEFSRSELDK